VSRVRLPGPACGTDPLLRRQEQLRAGRGYPLWDLGDGLQLSSPERYRGALLRRIFPRRHQLRGLCPLQRGVRAGHDPLRLFCVLLLYAVRDSQVGRDPRLLSRGPSRTDLSCQPPGTPRTGSSSGGSLRGIGRRSLPQRQNLGLVQLAMLDQRIHERLKRRPVRLEGVSRKRKQARVTARPPTESRRLD
jgi:hypothetical protein